MLTLDQFRTAFASEVGPEVATLAQAEEIDRWFNAGQRALGIYRERWQEIAWNALDIAISLPADFVRVDDLTPLEDCSLPAYRIFGNPKELIFRDPENVSAGSATLFYLGSWPRITALQASLLPDTGDDACLSYALYRFFKRLASSRSDYRKYSTMVAANGVDIEELDALSERHYNDFLATREELGMMDDQPLSFWEG